MALQAPQISYRLFNGVAKIIGINGGDIGTPNQGSFYGYQGFIEGTQTVVFDIATTETTFEVDLSGTAVKAGNRIVVRQYEENYGYDYSDASNTVLVLVKARPPVVNRVMETGMVNIKTELEPHPVSLDPVNFVIKLYSNGELIEDIPTASLDYDYPLVITENTVLTAAIEDADESLSSPSEPVYVTYTDIPQASTFEIAVNPPTIIDVPVAEITVEIPIPSLTLSTAINAPQIAISVDMPVPAILAGFPVMEITLNMPTPTVQVLPLGLPVQGEPMFEFFPVQRIFEFLIERSGDMQFKFPRPKQPSEKYPFRLNFANVLEAGETLTSISVNAYKSDGTVSNEVLAAYNTDGAKANVKVRDGADGETYKHTVRVTTSNDNAYEVDVFMPVQER